MFLKCGWKIVPHVFRTLFIFKKANEILLFVLPQTKKKAYLENVDS